MGSPPPVWTALPWLDWRLVRNRARAIARNPRRMVPWLLFLVLLVPNLVSRLLVASAAHHNPGVEPYAAVLHVAGRYVPGVALTVLGLALWQAGGRPVPGRGRHAGTAGPVVAGTAQRATPAARRLFLPGAARGVGPGQRPVR